MSAPDENPASSPGYDPACQQPKTLGQLWSFFDHLERRRRDHNLPLAVPLAKQTLAAMDRLRAYAGAKYGEPGPWLISLVNIRRLTSQYALDRGVSMREAEVVSLQQAAAFLAPRAPAPSRDRTPRKKPARRDRATEARDKWIYEKCCKRTPHAKIAAELKRRAPKRKWKIVSSKQRIQQIGNEYADRHGLEKPPPRQNL